MAEICRRCTLRRLPIALLLVGVLMLPGLAQPAPADAACVDTVTGVLLTALAPPLGIGLALGCTPFSDDPAACPITAVGASARRDEQRMLVHEFDYRLTEFCGDVHVVGSFSEQTGEVSERLTGGVDREARALWRCTGDPWVYTIGVRPSCTRLSVTLTGSHTGYEADVISQATYPLSAGSLSTVSRQALNGQLQNAIRQLPPPPPAQPLTPVPPPPRFLHVVKLGTTDIGAVTAVQYLLRHHGHDLQVDGDFGEQTDGAVRAFQAANGLDVDGVVGRETWQKLWVRPPAGRINDVARAVQTLLNRQGEALEVDGFFGPKTEAAVRAFQRAQGLIDDGIVGPNTWEALCARIVHLNPRPLP